MAKANDTTPALKLHGGWFYEVETGAAIPSIHRLGETVNASENLERRD